MSRKTLIFSTFLLLAIFSVSFLSVSSVNTNIMADKDQKNDSIETLLIPISSSYTVSQKWNVTTNEQLTTVAVSADGSYMVFGTWYTEDANYELCLKKISNNQTIWTYNYEEEFYSVAISKYGDYIVAGGAEPSAHPSYNLLLFDNSIPTGNKEPLWKYNTTNACYWVDISANGEYIVAGTESQGVLLFNNSIPVGQKYPHWQNLAVSDPESVAISADGEYIVVGNADGGSSSVLFYNNSYHPGTDKLPEWNYSIGVDVNTVAISKYGDYIVAGSRQQNPGNELFVFNKSADNGNPEWRYDYGTGTRIHSVAISADGEYIATGCEGPTPSVGEVGLFSNSKSQNLWKSSTGGTVNTVDITVDGKYIVAGTNYQLVNDRFNESILLYNQSANPTGNALPEWAFNTSYNVNSVSISAWGNYIGAGGEFTSESGRAYLFYHSRPIPRIISGHGDDDDDDDEEGAIPFGNHYLLFAAIAIASLVLITKRKAVFSKK